MIVIERANKQLTFTIEQDLFRAIVGKMVERVGDRVYMESWARGVAEASRRIERHIEGALTHEGEYGQRAREAFAGFVASLRAVINPSVTEADALGMLVQPIVTKPIFDAIFGEYDFLAKNTVAQSFDQAASVFETFAQSETRELDGFYRYVRTHARGLDRERERQDFLRRLYDTFFKVAFPKTAERLGIVYTPVERDGNAALARAVLLGEIPATRVWPTLLWLARTGVLGTPGGLAQRVEVLASPPPETLAAAGVLEQRIRARMGTRDTFWSAVRALAAEDAWYRREWDRFGQAAEQIGDLREQMHNLLRGEAHRQVAARMEAETERLAIMASEEAERSGIDPLRVVARWVRQPDIFGGKAWMKVIAYQLAQRLWGSGAAE